MFQLLDSSWDQGDKLQDRGHAIIAPCAEFQRTGATSNVMLQEWCIPLANSLLASRVELLTYWSVRNVANKVLARQPRVWWSEQDNTGGQCWMETAPKKCTNTSKQEVTQYLTWDSSQLSRYLAMITSWLPEKHFGLTSYKPSGKDWILTGHNTFANCNVFKKFVFS